MARKRKRRSYGMHHDARKVNRRALVSREKRTNVTVSVARSMTGHFTAIACAAHRGSSVKARHCGGLAGGTNPTNATARALRSLADTLSRER